ncbi:MAG: carbohydrate kinase family protein [Actinomycetes bacterium]
MAIDPVVLVIGDTNPDLVLRGSSGPTFGQAERLLDAADLVLGGSAAIMACGLARLGVPTAIVGLVGDDLMGGFVRTALEERGVDTRWLGTDPVQPTALTVVISAGDRAILTHPGALSTTTAAAVPDLDRLPSLRHVHAASYFLLPMLAPDLPGIFRHARELGLTTSLDTNWDPAERWSGVERVLPHVGTLLPNAVELAALTGEQDVDTAASSVTAVGCAVALKDGAEGGVLWTADGSRLTAPGIAVEVVDTTGAGDSFDAGFVSGLVEGLSPQECLERAVACGSLSTRAAGGTAAQATPDELAEVGS